MKFEKIYKETEENMRLALLSLWAPGNHPMRPAIEELLDNEPLLAEPVFQSTFGWEPATDTSWKSSINSNVWSQLEAMRKEKAEKSGKVFRPFTPFKHQAESWKRLKEGKSIVVTSGTGSGKTECFMYPVLSDLCEQGGTNAIQALFLYPLNALMEDQKNRLSDYCKATGLHFAVYNGDTPEYRTDGNPLPNEIGTRNDIRDLEGNGTRPEILLTNPSMLEYILVRDKDQQMLRESAGKLRWIVIDEAHSYSGSAAVELSYQIKRILDAFGMEAKDVRFACTSATIGGEEGVQSLVEFIANITGQTAEQIKVIGGRRVIPELDKMALEKDLKTKNLPPADKVLSLRQMLNEVSGASLRQIWEWLYPDKAYDNQCLLPALRLLDELCEMKQDNMLVLSLRAHFFIRTINGLYGCANKDCKGVNSGWPIYGHLTTYKASVCPDCGAPLLEILQCKRCQTYVLTGESDSQTQVVSPCEENLDTEDYFTIDPTDEQFEDEAMLSMTSPNTFYLMPYDKEKAYNPVPGAHCETVNIVRKGKNCVLEIQPEGNGCWMEIRKDANHAYCPGCGYVAQGKRSFLKHFRIPIRFINQTISPVLLQECAPADRSWGKYIAFTDSRQGTAISAKTFNIAVERNQCRANIIQHLAETQQSNFLDTLSDTQKATLTEEVIRMLMANASAVSNDMSLNDCCETIYSEAMFQHLTYTDPERNERAYKAALIRGTIGRRPAYETNIETMGFVKLVYPRLKNISLPASLADFAEQNQVNITDKDWQDYLKLTLDYVLRMDNHIQPLIRNERKYVRDTDLSTPIAEEEWPSVKMNSKQTVAAEQSRMVLLLCAGLGIHTLNALQNHWKKVNEILKDAWKNLVDSRILTRVNADDTEGYNNPTYFPDNKYVGCYYLDLSGRPGNETARITRLEKGWICPVTKQILDTTFCGYSPLIIGNICKGLFKKYHCTDESIEMPCRPKESEETAAWLAHDEKVANLKKSGLWTDRHKYTYQKRPVYIAAEHSAQQSKQLLKVYTENFSKPNPSINVLHCSTTMEMGVDIGDIDLVLMDTVPPTAANYLQRVGRAGRMGQSKAVAFSLCNNTPVGQHAFAHPMWALQTVNHMIKVRPSQTIIQRHINSYFFRKFICDNGRGIKTTISVDEFMSESCDAFIQFLDDISTEPAEVMNFRNVFGPNVPYTINITKDTIATILQKYNEVIQELEDAFNQFKNDTKRRFAISNQIRKSKAEGLLNYLSEHQFIPNANMPTGVVTFDFMDAEQADKIKSLYKKAEDLKNKIRNTTNDADKEQLQTSLYKVNKAIDEIHRATTASRDIHTALNEYAPGQTVVVNEKNYVSAGIALHGAYNVQTQTRAIYHCRHCGHTEYRSNLSEGLCCSVCGNAYHSIIDKKNSSYTLAYEPAGFRTDQNLNSSREEKTDKQYYDIRPVLLKADWSKRIEVNLCEIIGSNSETGNILFYNAGNGHGFAFCKRCGRAAIEYSASIEAASIPSAVKAGHKCLWGGDCDANDQDIARHVVFTGNHPTCYSVLRFKKDADNTEFENDQQLVYSLGVVLKRALALSEGIDETEIDFGIKQERDAWLLFMYDTAKGGCGYSLKFTNPVLCQEIFDIARQMLEATSCNCHQESGACSKCLIDRNNYKYAELLSKAKVMDWLNKQKMKAFEVPSTILRVSPSAKVVYQSLKKIVKSAINDPEVKNLTLCVTDADGDYAITDWASTRSEMGKYIHNAVTKGKNVSLMVEYHPELHTSLADKLPFISLKDKFPDCKLSLIKDMGTLKTAIIVETANRVIRYFTDTHELSFSNNWGKECNRVFVDDCAVSFAEQEEPAYSESPSEVIREGNTAATSFQVRNYFSAAIAPYVLKKGDLDLMSQVLKGKKVDITYSDMYVNSALASLMLVYLIDEMKQLFGFSIHAVNLQLDSPKRKCNNERYNDGTFISFNFSCKEDADEYTDHLFQQVLDVDPEHTFDNAKHPRWLRIKAEDGGCIEIRPDHSISGGYISNSKYMDIASLNGTVKAIRNDEDVLYYVIIKKAE